MRFVLASSLFISAALLAPGSAWAADGAPPSPPAPPAYAVVAASDCGCCPAPNPCRRSHLELQVHLAQLTPDTEGSVGVEFGADPARWDPIEYEPEIGGRVAFTFPWSSWDVTIAGTYWGSWSDDQTDFGTLTSTPFPGGLPATSGPFDVELHEESMLWDVNLTFTRAWYCTPCFTSRWGFGVRYLHFDEQADFTFPTGVIALTLANVASDIDNDLFAGELVAEATWKLSSCFDFTVRGSVFAGLMHRSGEITLTGTPQTLTDPEGEEDDLGFGGELELALRWHPSACWSLSVGYGVLFLGNVTRAHEAFDFSNTASNNLGPVFADDTLLVHRVFLGVGFDL